jgi:hypothetical protein
MVQLPDIEVATGATSQYRSSIEISGRMDIRAGTYITESDPFARQHYSRSV